MEKGIYKHAGKIRDYNITKKEWVLDGATVIYGSASELRATLEYDFSQEKNFSYKYLSMDEIIHHLAVFISNLWQIHIFGEGNTRTTAVFFIKYLRILGFSATNDILRKMHGILEMRLSVQITRICRKVFMKQQNILKYSSEIYF